MLQNPTELPNCQPKVEKMVKGIQWLYPDVENAVHSPTYIHTLQASVI